MSNTPKLTKPEGPNDGYLNLDALIAEAEGNYPPYVFRLGGEKHELPHIQSLSSEQALRIESAGPLDLLREVAGEDVGVALMKIPAFAMNAVLEGWMKHSDVNLGEGVASASS